MVSGSVVVVRGITFVVVDFGTAVVPHVEGDGLVAVAVESAALSPRPPRINNPKVPPTTITHNAASATTPFVMPRSSRRAAFLESGRALMGARIMPTAHHLVRRFEAKVLWCHRERSSF